MQNAPAPWSVDLLLPNLPQNGRICPQNPLRKLRSKPCRRLEATIVRGGDRCGGGGRQSGNRFPPLDNPAQFQNVFSPRAPWRREEACRRECTQNDGAGASDPVKRQRGDSPLSSFRIEACKDEQAGTSHASCSYGNVADQARVSPEMIISAYSPVADILSSRLDECIDLASIDQKMKGVERSTGKRSQGPRTRKYLRPGQLAKLVDDHKRSRTPCTTLGRKRVLGDTNSGERSLAVAVENVNTRHLLAPSVRSPAPTSRDFGPTCPQRKKMLAPRTPLTPAAQLIVMRSPIDASNLDAHTDSPLEALPVELLVRIVCSLHHDQLKPAFHVCRRLRQAVLIARQWHFNFTTPDHERQKSLGLSTPSRDQQWPFWSACEAPGGPDARPATPQAPRHAPKPQQARVLLADLRQIAAPLFQGPGSQTPQNRPPGLPGPHFRAVASHRVLFNEEELCKAVAQHTL